MDWTLTEDEQLLVDAAREFLAKEASDDLVWRWDEAGEYPSELFQKMAELGWFEMGLTDDGDRRLATRLVALCEELGRASSDIVALYNLNVSGLRDVVRYGSEGQRERIVPAVLNGERRFSIAVSEPDVGSDSAAITTQAVRDGDGWRLSGQKTYCEGAGLPGALIAVYAKTGDQGRKSQNLSVFLVDGDHPDLTVRRMPALGRNISGIYELFFDDLTVPADAVLGGVGDGWSILKQRLVLERLMISSGFVGSVRTLIDKTVKYANEREQFGRPIGDYQGVSHDIAAAYVRYDAARCAVRRSAALFDRGEPCELESTMAKLNTGQLYADVSATAMQIHGAYGYVLDHSLPMHYADGIIASVVAGPPHLQRNVVAHHLGLGRGARR